MRNKAGTGLNDLSCPEPSLEIKRYSTMEVLTTFPIAMLIAVKDLFYFRPLRREFSQLIGNATEFAEIVNGSSNSKCKSGPPVTKAA